MRLRDHLARHDLDGRALLAREALIPLAQAAACGALADLRGRNVLLATASQLTSAAALVALDGCAARLVLCPPDVAPAHLPGLMAAAAVDCLVCDADTIATFAAFDVPRIVLGPETWRKASASSAPTAETEWVLLTSGTTGMPKLVIHTLAGLTGAIVPRAGDGAHIWATFYDIRRYGGLQIFLRAMLGGSTLVLADADEHVAVHLARLGAAGVTHISGTPSHWRRVLMSEAARRMRPAYVRLSGEIADAAVLDGLAALYPDAGVAHAYASSEAGVAFAVDDGREGVPAAMIDGPQGAVELRLVDGALQIRSPRTALRYLGPNAPALRGADGFVDTGDMLERRGARYLFVGRRGGIVNIGGQKVHPEEVEAVINGIAGVRMSRVKARKNPITGAIVVADVLPRDAAVHADATAAESLRADILARCRASLPAHKVPARIAFVAALDVLPTGKLARGDA